MKKKTPILRLIAYLVNKTILTHTFIVILIAYKNPFEAIWLYKAIRKAGKLFHRNPKIIKTRYIDGRLYWCSDIPGWKSKSYNAFILNACSNYFKSPSVQKRLQTAIFAITNRCPLNCEHCFEWDNIASAEVLGLEDLNHILNQLLESGVSSIQFSGGEPLSRFNDLLHLIKSVGPKTDSWLLTSGFGLTESKAIRLKNAGLTGVYISLDHWDESAHNIFRNNSQSFKWVKEATINCNKFGIVTGLSLCASNEFISQENLYKYLELAKELDVTFIRILEARKVGKCKTKNIEPTNEQLCMLEDFYLDVNFSQNWLDYPIIVYPGGYQRNIGCYGAGINYIYIDSHGCVHACPFCQHSVGSLLNEPLSSLINKLITMGCHKYKAVEFLPVQ